MTAQTLRHRIDADTYADPQTVLNTLVDTARLSGDQRGAISKEAAGLVRDIRNTTAPGMMEVFLAEYGLSTDCLLYTSPSPRDRG